MEGQLEGRRILDGGWQKGKNWDNHYSIINKNIFKKKRRVQRVENAISKHTGYVKSATFAKVWESFLPSSLYSLALVIDEISQNSIPANKAK